MTCYAGHQYKQEECGFCYPKSNATEWKKVEKKVDYKDCLHRLRARLSGADTLSKPSIQVLIDMIDEALEPSLTEPKRGAPSGARMGEAKSPEDFDMELANELAQYLPDWVDP